MPRTLGFRKCARNAFEYVEIPAAFNVNLSRFDCLLGCPYFIPAFREVACLGPRISDLELWYPACRHGTGHGGRAHQEQRTRPPRVALNSGNALQPSQVGLVVGRKLQRALPIFLCFRQPALLRAAASEQVQGGGGLVSGTRQVLEDSLRRGVLPFSRQGSSLG